MVNEKEWSHWWHHPQLNISCLQAHHIVRAFPRHSHDYYVVAVVDSGVQSFTSNGTHYVTPANGLILLNPGDVHTGEPANEKGFVYRALYPTIEHMETISTELGVRNFQPPYFAEPRVDDPQMARWIRSLFAALRGDENPIESETRFIMTFIELVKRYGGQKVDEPDARNEHQAVQQVRDYIHANYAQPISLTEVAELVNFSRYYVLRMFRDAVGMPPHLYLQNVRVRQAQKLLLEGKPLAEVALEAGFASQSHFTQQFKQIIGVTPGVYVRHLKSD